MATVSEIHDSLMILQPIEADNSIESYQYIDYTPQSQDNLDTHGKEIHIDINASDTYLNISESYLVIKGQLVRDDNENPYAAEAEVTLVNNAMMYLFNQIKYTIGGKIMEQIANPGQITSMFAYLTQPDDYNSSAGLKSCWCKDTTNNADSKEFVASVAAPAAGYIPAKNPNYNQGFAARRSLLMSATPRGSFTFVIPFDHMFGFAGYNKVIYNIKHSLSLTRAASDNLAIHRANGVAAGKIKISNITWRVPHVIPDLETKSGLNDIIINKQLIPVSFLARSSENNTVSQARNFSWRLQVSGGVEKPRWIVIGFQTDRDDTQEQNPAVFDNLKITNIYVILNGERYPQMDTPIDFPTNDYSEVYERFDNYKKEKFRFNSLIGGTQVSYPAFKSLFPIFIFDVRKQGEKLASGVIDLQLKVSFSEAVPANTRVYAAIESDRVYKLASDGKNLTMVSY
jgi:hypothetical protein